MARNGDDARRRLQGAALELFQERGYDDTTAAQIAARAGVTERTFFRHFKDKREVLFDGEQLFRETLAAGVAATPADADPLTAVLCGYRAVEGMIEANRAFSEPRHRVIASAPALQERMLAKAAGLVEAVAGALRRRGVEAGVAILAAQVGSAVFNRALEAWMAQPDAGLADHLRRAEGALRGLALAAEPRT